MKLSEIGRYWTAKQLTMIRREGNRITLDAPFGTPNFTFKIRRASGPVRHGGELREVSSITNLESATWISQGRDVIVCIDLPRGTTRIDLSS